MTTTEILAIINSTSLTLSNPTYKYKDIDMPSPSKEEMDSDVFNAIWDVIKHWDINVPDYYNGYTGGNGSHVKLILDSLKPVLRNNKIETILK